MSDCVSFHYVDNNLDTVMLRNNQGAMRPMENNVQCGRCGINLPRRKVPELIIPLIPMLYLWLRNVFI